MPSIFVPDPRRTRLAVLGKPIAHSKSPALQRAAYRVLGVPWTYERFEVDEGGLAAFVDRLDATWRGLSLTMPLKHEAIALSDTLSDAARITGAVNTLVLLGGTRAGYNTDVFGIVQALWQRGISSVDRVHLLGAGATATSVLAACAQLGAVRASVAARRPEQLEELGRTARAFGVHVEPVALADAGDARGADLVVNTIPGEWDRPVFPEAVRRSAPLLEVVYNVWPSPLGAQWEAAGGLVVSGLDMLLWQAVLQVRLFLGVGDDDPMPREGDVIDAMRNALANG